MWSRVLLIALLCILGACTSKDQESQPSAKTADEQPAAAQPAVEPAVPPATPVAEAPAQMIETESQATIEQVIEEAYADPRVVAVVEQAQAEKRSISVELTDTGEAQTDYLISESANVALPPARPSAEIRTSEPAPRAQASAGEKSWWNAHTHFGVLLDAGVPDGIGASAVFRPWKWLRVHAGGAYNGISGGIRAGVTVLPPMFFPVLPTATLEVGHAFEGDANWIVRKFSSDPSFSNPTLRRVSYDYVNGHLGLELGAQNSFVFYIHGGVSYLSGTAREFQKTLDQGGASSGDTTFTAKDPKVSLVAPTGKVGFILYFL